jgi:hypothetical protein
LNKGFKPGDDLPWKAVLALGLVVGAVGIHEVVEPRRPPFTGKLSFVFQLAYSAVGELGPALVWFALSAAVLAAAFALKRGTIKKF